MRWDKKSLLSFFREHISERIMLEEPNTRFTVCGQVMEVEELELCSHTLLESSLRLESTNVEVAITFHDNFIGIHFMVHQKDSTIELSFPYQIKYSALKITVPEKSDN